MSCSMTGREVGIIRCEVHAAVQPGDRMEEAAVIKPASCLQSC
jgi:hypothetical protein